MKKIRPILIISWSVLCLAVLCQGREQSCFFPFNLLPKWWLPALCAPACMRVSLQQPEPDHRRDILCVHGARKWKDQVKIKADQPLSSLGAWVSLFGTVQDVRVSVYLPGWAHRCQLWSWEVQGASVCVSNWRGGTTLVPSVPAAVKAGQSVWAQLLQGSSYLWYMCVCFQQWISILPSQRS